MKLKKLVIISIFTLGFISLLKSQNENQFFWPKDIVKGETTVTLYQPQLDSLGGNILKGRTAFSVTKKEKKPVFGTFWFTARLLTDMDERTAVLKNINIDKVVFPDVSETDKIDRFSKFLKKEIESWDLLMSIDRIKSAIESENTMRELSVNLNNNPPDIYFRTTPAALIIIDGDPVLKKINGENFQYVVNTPFFIVKDAKNRYYIKGGKFWYSSDRITSGYKNVSEVPKNIMAFAEANKPADENDSVISSFKEAPQLIVVTKPSELLITDGKPEYSPVEGTELLYVTNTESDIIMDIPTQYYYVLLSGRWYRSKTLEDGSWKFVEPGDLPSDFSKIPENSEIKDVRVSVPGTPEAEEALAEQFIPQTAEVDRKTTTVEVNWDGEPKFEKIKDTDISVAKNSDKTVLLIKDKYYCVDDAIWFVADKPSGPWRVSDVRPDEVDKIPPESEAYNVKYVYVYESTPDVVYVGYLPGYIYSYPYGGCVFYGTGYWYRPWYGHYYYPRPVTFGFGVHWNPYTGWGFSIGFRAGGWIGWGFHPYARAYWGPRGYRYGYRYGYARGYRHGYYHGARRSYARVPRGSYNNVYRNRSRGVKTAAVSRDIKTGNRNLNKVARPSKKPNNVFSDKKGNVYQRDNKGNWQKKSNSRQGSKPAAKPSKRPANNQKQKVRPSTQAKPQTKQNRSISNKQRQQLNRSYQNRSRGNVNYNRSRSVNRGGMSRGRRR
jgi:hypothetical protein